MSTLQQRLQDYLSMRRQLGQPKAGLDGQHEQGMVAASEPGRAIGGGEELLDLCVREEPDDRPTLTLIRDRQHALNVCRERGLLLAAGVDSSVIALWLGHESVNTTQIYLHAHLALKEAALAKTSPFRARPGRFRPDDRLLGFLNAL